MLLQPLRGMLLQSLHGMLLQSLRGLLLPPHAPLLQSLGLQSEPLLFAAAVLHFSIALLPTTIPNLAVLARTCMISSPPILLPGTVVFTLRTMAHTNR